MNFFVLLSKKINSELFEQLQNCLNIVGTKCGTINRTINCSNNTPSGDAVLRDTCLHVSESAYKSRYYSVRDLHTKGLGFVLS
jgi:hypothetical protein